MSQSHDDGMEELEYESMSTSERNEPRSSMGAAVEHLESPIRIGDRRSYECEKVPVHTSAETQAASTIMENGAETGATSTITENEATASSVAGESEGGRRSSRERKKVNYNETNEDTGENRCHGKKKKKRTEGESRLYSFMPKDNKYQVYYRYAGRQYNLGRVDTEDQAICARDTALEIIRQNPARAGQRKGEVANLVAIIKNTSLEAARRMTKEAKSPANRDAKGEIQEGSDLISASESDEEMKEAHGIAERSEKASVPSICAKRDGERDEAIDIVTSDVKGVTWREHRKKWEVKTTYAGENRYIGRYDSKVKAVCALNAAKEVFLQNIPPDDQDYVARDKGIAAVREAAREAAHEAVRNMANEAKFHEAASCNGNDGINPNTKRKAQILKDNSFSVGRRGARGYSQDHTKKWTPYFSYGGKQHTFASYDTEEQASCARKAAMEFLSHYAAHAHQRQASKAKVVAATIHFASEAVKRMVENGEVATDTTQLAIEAVERMMEETEAHDSANLDTMEQPSVYDEAAEAIAVEDRGPIRLETRRNKWDMRVKFRGRELYIGLFASQDQATRAQLAALAKLLEASRGGDVALTKDEMKKLAKDAATESAKETENSGLKAIAQPRRKRHTAETDFLVESGVDTKRPRRASERAFGRATRKQRSNAAKADNAAYLTSYGDSQTDLQILNQNRQMLPRTTPCLHDIGRFTVGLPPQHNVHEYEEETAWRFHNPPLPPAVGGVEPEKLPPLLPPPSIPAFPNTSDCEWKWDEDSRVLLGNFRKPDGNVYVNPHDEKFLLEMMERDEITVICEGLADGLNRELWGRDYVADAAGNEYYHKFRKFQRKTANAEDTVDQSSNNETIIETESGDFVTYEEVDKCVSMKVADFFRYLNLRKAKLTDRKMKADSRASKCEGETVDDSVCEIKTDNSVSERETTEEIDFTFTDDCGKEHAISNVIDVVYYMIDFDMVKLLPELLDDFKSTFKLSGCLPGGTHCMMNAVNVGGRPFMGPNLYITPPSSFTHFHQDGHGTVDSGHQCLSGFNEVVMLRRLTERHKKHALSLLNRAGGVSNRKGAPSQYDGLYGLPHGDGMGKKPMWPDREAIENCKQMGYCPSVFILKPGQLVHINKGRLHAFRKLAPVPLPDADCHAELRASILQNVYQDTDDICVSVAWDWMYRGTSCKGINREVVATLECASLNRTQLNQSLAIPELSLLQMARLLTSRRNLDSSFLGHWNGPSTAPLQVGPSREIVLKGILPSLRFVVGQHVGAERLADARKNPRTTEARVSKPNSWENPDTFTLDPYGNGDFFCKLCYKELSNVYMHCDGCEKILNKDFNICVDCHAEEKYKVFYQMHPLNDRKHCTVNHTGNFLNSRQKVCPCKNGPACKNCSYCSGCSCKCHQWFTLNCRFLSVEDEKRLLKKVEDTVGVFPAKETMSRLAWIGGWANRTCSSTDGMGTTIETKIKASDIPKNLLIDDVSDIAVRDEVQKSANMSSAQPSDGKCMAVGSGKNPREHPNVCCNEDTRMVPVADELLGDTDEETKNAAAEKKLASFSNVVVSEEDSSMECNGIAASANVMKSGVPPVTTPSSDECNDGAAPANVTETRIPPTTKFSSSAAHVLNGQGSQDLGAKEGIADENM